MVAPAGDMTGSFASATGLVVDEAGPTRVVGHVELGPEHLTPWGIVHGGLYATVVESVASIGASAAVKDQGKVAVGLTNTTNFLKSLHAGRVQVVATALSQRRTHQLWTVELTDGDGQLVAHGQLRLQNVPARR